MAQIKFKDIGPPQPDDKLTRRTLDIVHNLKAIDESCLDYFEDIAMEFAYDEGA